MPLKCFVKIRSVWFFQLYCYCFICIRELVTFSEHSSLLTMIWHTLSLFPPHLVLKACSRCINRWFKRRKFAQRTSQFCVECNWYYELFMKPSQERAFELNKNLWGQDLGGCFEKNNIELFESIMQTPHQICIIIALLSVGIYVYTYYIFNFTHTLIEFLYW